MKIKEAAPAAVDVKALKLELRKWWADESSDWDAQVAGAGAALPGGAGLWDSMPQVDSKAVAKTAPIFERHLGRPLDVKLIKAGGYLSIDAMIDHLVPAMLALTTK